MSLKNANPSTKLFLIMAFRELFIMLNSVCFVLWIIIGKNYCLTYLTKKVILSPKQLFRDNYILGTGCQNTDVQIWIPLYTKCVNFESILYIPCVFFHHIPCTILSPSLLSIFSPFPLTCTTVCARSLNSFHEQDSDKNKKKNFF